MAGSDSSAAAAAELPSPAGPGAAAGSPAAAAGWRGLRLPSVGSPGLSVFAVIKYPQQTGRRQPAPLRSRRGPPRADRDGKGHHPDATGITSPVADPAGTIARRRGSGRGRWRALDFTRYHAFEGGIIGTFPGLVAQAPVFAARTGMFVRAETLNEVRDVVQTGLPAPGSPGCAPDVPPRVARARAARRWLPPATAFHLFLRQGVAGELAIHGTASRHHAGTTRAADIRCVG